jgi:D-sedoheptulose 7-phosphate isomerase
VTEDSTGFLYPFLGDAEEDTDDLLTVLAASARSKWADSVQLGEHCIAAHDDELRAAARAVAERASAGGRVLVFGNGGSAADADAFVQLLCRPSIGAPVAARSLVADASVLTALGNDIGVDSVFARQLMAHARPVDVALGFSTSGNSANLVAAFAEARRSGLTTVGFAGYDGGAMAASGHVEHCLIVDSDSVHRIQEAQVVLAHRLWEMLQSELEAGVPA